MKKLALFALALPLALLVHGCTDAGDPVIPGGGAVTGDVTITLTDMVGDWDNLAINGDLTGNTAVVMTQDGIVWSATVADVEPGTYTYGVFFDDGSKAWVPVLENQSVTVGENGSVSGATAVTAEPGAGTGFNLVVMNNNPEYDDIKFKGAYSDPAWEVVDRTGMSADGMYVYKHIPAGLSAGSYEWGVIQDDGSEFGIWLLPAGPNLSFTVDAEGVVTGDMMFTIEAPNPPAMVTFEVDMSGETVSGDGVHIAGSFGADGYTEWQPGAIGMIEGDNGIWSVTLELTSDNEYQFAFINGATWEGQESVPEACGLDNGFGGYNRTLTAGTEPMTYSTVFGGCPE